MLATRDELMCAISQYLSIAVAFQKRFFAAEQNYQQYFLFKSEVNQNDIAISFL